jgi:hypothetical protein
MLRVAGSSVTISATLVRHGNVNNVSRLDSLDRHPKVIQRPFEQGELQAGRDDNDDPQLK